MLTASQKRRIQRIARERSIAEAMELANELLNGDGVASIWGDGGYDPDIEYVDLGDSYEPTVMYDRVTERFLWSMSVKEIVDLRLYCPDVLMDGIYS